MNQRQFGIRSLLFTVTICAVIASWIAGWLRHHAAGQRGWKPWNKSSVRVTVDTNVPQHTFSFDGPGVIGRDESASQVDASARGPVPINVDLLRNVRQVRFADAHFDAESIRRLASIEQLSDLRIKNSLIPPNVIQQLCHLPLIRLDFVSCGFSDPMLEGCQSLHQLKILYLVDNELTDKCVRRLATLTQLERLDLRGNPVSESSIKQLKRSLPGCVIRFGDTDAAD